VKAAWYSRRALRLAQRIDRFSAYLWARLRLPARATDLALLSKLNPADVCILGSGPAGSVLGFDLVQRGWRVLIIESAADQRFAGQGFRNSGELEYPFAASRYRGFGGTSALWFGACPRLRPIDFERNAYTPPGADWPLRYVDLEPYYDQAEQSLAVRYGPVGQGPKAGGASCSNGAAGRWLEQAGLALEPSGVARAPGGPDCFRVARDLLPGYCRASGQAMLAIGTATEVLHDGDGRVYGLTVRDNNGRSVNLRARAYVLACGGLETPRLLLASRSASFPDGIGNRSSLAGRFFMEHFKLRFRGTLRSAFSASGRCFQYYEQFKQQGLGSPILAVDLKRLRRSVVLGISADVEMFPCRQNRVALAPDDSDRPGETGASLALRLSDRDMETVEAVGALVCSIYKELGAKQVVALPGHVGHVSWLFHHMGTCRMGNDPSNSVIDANLRVHDSPNLYLAGSAPFVTGGGSNPTLTIAALSHRLADHLHERLAGPA